LHWNHLGIKKEQLIWNDIITFNSIGNERKQWYQLHGIGCNSWTSSIGGAIDLEWYYLIECNWVSKEQMVSITWNRMQFMDFLNWRINWSGITLSLLFNLNKKKQWYQWHGIGCNSWTSSIGGAIDLEWYYLIQFNWESKETMVTITWNRMQFMDFLNWRINWLGITLSLLFNLK